MLCVCMQYVSNTIWRHLFNKEADSLQRSMENEDECQLTNFGAMIYYMPSTPPWTLITLYEIFSVFMLVMFIMWLCRYDS